MYEKCLNSFIRPIYNESHNSHPMALTAAQATAFFGYEDQMGMPHATVVRLATEGIMSVIDLADFDKEYLQQLADNLRGPGWVSDPNPAAQPGATIATKSGWGYR
jgi:hypothetical protein